MNKVYLYVSLVFFALTMSGCSHVSHISYVIQAGLGQWSLYNHERPLDEVIQDPRTPEKVRERLKWIPEIKKLVEAELEVPATSNYTTYVDLKRPYVIWSLTAAEKYQLKIKQWKFPIVGSFPYLGFFKEDMAKDWQKDHETREFDTYLRGVSAYSTLGYLKDPLLSSMLTRNKADLVNLIYHETTHGQIYLKGEGSFNEQVASYIGDYGERQWLLKSYGAESPEFKKWQIERDERRRFGKILREFAEKLEKHYIETAALSDDAKEARKKEKFSELKRRLESEPGAMFSRAAKVVVNNASLLAFLTYEDDQELFDLLDKKCSGNIKLALRYLKKFEKDWDQLKASGATAQAAQPGTKNGKSFSPQAALLEKLLRNTSGAVCLDVDVH